MNIYYAHIDTIIIQNSMIKFSSNSQTTIRTITTIPTITPTITITITTTTTTNNIKNGIHHNVGVFPGTTDSSSSLFMTIIDNVHNEFNIGW